MSPFTTDHEFSDVSILLVTRVILGTELLDHDRDPFLYEQFRSCRLSLFPIRTPRPASVNLRELVLNGFRGRLKGRGRSMIDLFESLKI